MELDEELFDKQLEKAARDQLRDIGCELNEAYHNADEPVELSPTMKSFLDRYSRQVERKRRAERRRLFYRSHKKYFKAAVACFVLGLVFSYIRVDAFRTPINNLLTNVFEDFTELAFKLENTIPFSNGPFQVYLPEYIPTPLDLISSNSQDNSIITIFEGEQEKLTLIQQLNTSATYHNGQSDVIPEDLVEPNITINGLPGYLSQARDKTTRLVWYNDSTILIINSTLSSEEIIKVAESIYIN